jgi:hypothetical protein
LRGDENASSCAHEQCCTSHDVVGSYLSDDVHMQPRALGRRPSEFAVPLCRSHHRAVHRAGDERNSMRASIPPSNDIIVSRERTELKLRRVSNTEDDFDVLAEGAVVGRIFKVNAEPVGTPWMWTLAFGHHEDRTPTHGYAETREAAMAAFAKSWRRQRRRVTRMPSTSSIHANWRQHDSDRRWPTRQRDGWPMRV